MFSFNILCSIKLIKNSEPEYIYTTISHEKYFNSINKLTRKIWELINQYGYHNIKFEVNGIDISTIKNEERRMYDFVTSFQDSFYKFEWLRHILIKKTKTKELAKENLDSHMVFFFNDYCKINNYNYEKTKAWICQNNIYFVDNSNYIISRGTYNKIQRVIDIGLAVDFDKTNLIYKNFRNASFSKYLRNKSNNSYNNLSNECFKKLYLEILSYIKSYSSIFIEKSLSELIEHYNKNGVQFFRYEVEKFKRSKEQELELYNNSISISAGSWNATAIADGKIEPPTGTATRKSVKTVNSHPHKFY